MQIGAGLDQTLGLTWEEQREIARQAVALGYASAWTPSSPTGRDALHICAQWSAAVGREPAAIGTGTLVVPVPVWNPVTLAAEAATVGELTGGRFVLGIGPGGAYQEPFRRMFGLQRQSPVSLMRAYLSTLRALLRGETVQHESAAFTLRGAELSIRPPRVPVYLAALGPRMLRLAGELADGAAPNWCTPEQVAWCREQVATGARASGRDPAEVPIAQYIRVCVDDDEDAARRALAAQVLGYALARPGASKEEGYRGHFGRMGFEEVLTELEARRDSGAPRQELVDAVPAELLRRVGYFGRSDGAAAAFRRLAAGLDVAIVRVVAVRPGLNGALATLEACRPARVSEK